MDQAFRMFDVLTLISIVIGSLGVVNTLTMSVIERTREIGMLRAVGTTRGQIILMVLAEASLMGESVALWVWELALCLPEFSLLG